MMGWGVQTIASVIVCVRSVSHRADSRSEVPFNIVCRKTCADSDRPVRCHAVLHPLVRLNPRGAMR